jgi:hypothetical protein
MKSSRLWDGDDLVSERTLEESCIENLVSSDS